MPKNVYVICECSLIRDYLTKKLSEDKAKKCRKFLDYGRTWYFAYEIYCPLSYWPDFCNYRRHKEFAVPIQQQGRFCCILPRIREERITIDLFLRYFLYSSQRLVLYLNWNDINCCTFWCIKNIWNLKKHFKSL